MITTLCFDCGSDEVRNTVPADIFKLSITVGLGGVLVHPSVFGIKVAGDFIIPLGKAIAFMVAYPDLCKEDVDEPAIYHSFLIWLVNLMDFCKKNMGADVRVVHELEPESEPI